MVTSWQFARGMTRTMWALDRTAFQHGEHDSSRSRHSHKLLASALSLGFESHIARQFCAWRAGRAYDSLPQDRVLAPLSPEHIRRIIAFSDPEFASLTGCDAYFEPLGCEKSQLDPVVSTRSNCGIKTSGSHLPSPWERLSRRSRQAMCRNRPLLPKPSAPPQSRDRRSTGR
jgi:hypothetical protein